MTDRNGSKATIREVRDLIDKLDDEKISPMKIILTRIETKLDIHLASDGAYKKNNNDEHKGFISRKLFITLSAILGVLMTYLGIIQFVRGG
jgi:hypothetical protein